MFIFLVVNVKTMYLLNRYKTLGKVFQRVERFSMRNFDQALPSPHHLSATPPQGTGCEQRRLVISSNFFDRAKPAFPFLSSPRRSSG